MFGAFLSFGQFALGGLAVLLVLTPFFGLPAEAGSLLEMSFAGGHGTIAGMGQVFSDEGAPELVDIGLGLATISMVTGVVVGSMLVRWAVRHPRIPLRRNEPLRSDENYDVDDIHVVPADAKPANETGLHPTTLAFALIGVTILVSVGILWGARAIVSALGSDILDKMPLFPVAVIGGFIVQWVVTRTGQAHRVDKRAIEGISSIALDVLLVCAIGTMSLATIGSNVPAIVVFTVVGVGWSVVCLIWLGRDSTVRIGSSTPSPTSGNRRAMSRPASSSPTWSIPDARPRPRMPMATNSYRTSVPRWRLDHRAVGAADRGDRVAVVHRGQRRRRRSDRGVGDAQA